MLIPKQIKPGDTIGIVAPSGRIHQKEDFEKGIRVLHEMGFKTKFPRDLWPGVDYLADSDQNRSEEFLRIWLDNEVDFIMAARGGFGCIRMAANIDIESLKNTPKLFVGFSDITLLHNILNAKDGLVTLHGPVVTSLPRISKSSLESFTDILYGNLKFTRKYEKIEVLRYAPPLKGITTGGNLSTIISTLGTPYEQSWQNKIVFLEDTCEALYRIDRMLSQLHLSGKFKEAAAVILGDFSHGLGLDRIEVMRHHESIWKRTLELTGKQTAVWAGFPIGHAEQNFSIPLGIDTTMDSSRTELCFS